MRVTLPLSIYSLLIILQPCQNIFANGCDMPDLANIFGAFGNVNFFQNSNFKFSGRNNTGAVLNNSNLSLFANNCNLTLEGNSNAKVDIQNSAFVNFVKCSNIKLSGKGNKINLENTSNAKIDGDENDLEICDNSNIKTASTGAVLKLKKNNNISVGGRRSEVIAENNSNLKVDGDGGKVVVKNTRNHWLTPAIGGQPQQNEVEIVLDEWSLSSATIFGSNWLARRFAGSDSVKFNLNYVNEASIDGPRYQLGIFRFSLMPLSATNYEVKIDETSVQPGSIVAINKGEDHVTLSAVSEGNTKQKLKLTASQVTQSASEPNVFMLNVAPAQNSNI